MDFAQEQFEVIEAASAVLVNVRDRKYDLSSFVRRTGEHFMSPTRFFEREHRAHLGGYFSGIEQLSKCAQPGRRDVHQEEH